MQDSKWLVHSCQLFIDLRYCINPLKNLGGGGKGGSGEGSIGFNQREGHFSRHEE